MTRRLQSRCTVPRLLALLALLTLVPATGCQSEGGEEGGDEARADGPVAPSFAPVVFPHATPRRADAPVDVRDRRGLEDDEAGWQEKLELARRYAAGGFDAEALQVLDAALGLEPPAAWAEKLRALESSLQMRRAEEALLRVEARARRDYVPFQRDVDFVLRFRNVSDEVVTLLAPAPGAVTSPSAAALEIKRLDRDIYATELKRSWNQTVFLSRPGDPPVRIPPGGVHEFPVRIPASEAGPAISGLRVLEVGGTIRPTRLKKGDAWRTVRLRIRKGRVVALPRGFEPLVDRPLASMRTAIETVAPIHLLLATEFVPSSRRAEAAEILAGALETGHASLQRASLGGLSLLRQRAVGRPLRPLVQPLIEALERSPGRAEVLMEGLSTLTDVRLAPDRRLWMDWWRRESERRTVVTAGDEAS